MNVSQKMLEELFLDVVQRADVGAHLEGVVGELHLLVGAVGDLRHARGLLLGRGDAPARQAGGPA